MNEQEIRFELKQVKGAIGGNRYRAEIKRGDIMDTDAVFAQISDSLNMPANRLKSLFIDVLKELISNTLADGRTRRIGDIMNVRLDIEGVFNRPDEAYDPQKHSLKVNFVQLKELRNVYRNKDPKNVMPPPRGRVEHVYSENGEIGIIHFNRKIILEGTNLVLPSSGSVRLRVFTPEFGEEADYGCEIEENTSSRLVVRWPTAPMLTREMFLAAKRGKVIWYNPEMFYGDDRGNGTPRGNHTSVLFAE